jgi:hypothetical protein
MTLSTRLFASLSAVAVALALLTAQSALAQTAEQPNHYGTEPSHKAAHDGTTHKAGKKKPKAKPKADKKAAASGAKHSAQPGKKHTKAPGQHSGKKASKAKAKAQSKVN